MAITAALTPHGGGVVTGPCAGAVVTEARFLTVREAQSEAGLSAGVLSLEAPLLSPVFSHGVPLGPDPSSHSDSHLAGPGPTLKPHFT